MAIPRPPKKYADKDRIDNAIDAFTALDKPTRGDLNKVKTAAQVQEGIDLYRAKAAGMTLDELECEKHESARLGVFLSATDPRPHPLCDAHAIISGGHSESSDLRATMAWFQRRIDDPTNGCWLPRNTAAKIHMPKRLRNAVAHSRIHRKRYYRWLESFIGLDFLSTDTQFDQALVMAGLHLQHSTFPKDVMLPAERKR